MTIRTQILAAAATALLLGTPVFAHDHGQGHGDASMHHGDGGCPHHQATATAVSQALTLLEQASTQSGDTAKTTIDQARQQLTEAQKQMASCQEMCKTKMAAHGEEGHECPMHGAAGHAMHAAAGQTDKVTDPVCGMEIDAKSAAGKSVYAGKTYYFCSQEEKEKFDKDPESYLKKQA